MEVRATTFRLAFLKTNDFTVDFVDSIGVSSHFDEFGTIVCVAGRGG
jgi:ferredoxin--NADP+ reductase